MKSNQNIARFVRVLDDLDQKAVREHLDRIPGLIMSHPGAGKTSTLRKYCEYKDYNLVEFIPSRCQADDVLGTQIVDKGVKTMERATPAWYTRLEKKVENGKRTILFIDELSTCDPFIQGPLLDFIFSRSLGDHVLNDNVFIIAAGNYSKDLNCEFKMSAPLVNRFMVLNLWISDIDVDEIFNGTFHQQRTPEEDAAYYGFNAETPEYDFKRFKEWAQGEREIQCSTNFKIVEDNEYGMLGFASGRSIEFVLRFAEAYMNTYADDLWMRICGDTLGTSVKRENKLMRVVFENNVDKYSGGIKEELRCIAEICGDILKKGVTAELKGELNKAIKGVKNSRELSGQDCRKFNDVAIKYSDSDGDIAYMADTLNKIVSATI